MENTRLQKSRKLSRLNLNTKFESLEFINYWCRIAFSKYDTWNLKEHSHSFFELQLCLKGVCRFDVSGREYTITEGTYILLPPYKKHTILEASDDFEKFIWGFKLCDENISAALAKGCLEETVSQSEKEWFSAIDVIMANADSNEFEASGIIKGQLYYLLCMLIRKSTRLCCGEREEKSLSLAASEIKSFIKGNLSSAMSVSDIAAQFYMSARQITRICEKEYGCTTKELETALRLEEIRKLLSDYELPLDEVAKRCGFADGYSMSKFFKKHEGMPPGKYRYSLKE